MGVQLLRLSRGLLGVEAVSFCEVCGRPIEDFADVCERHALSNEQLAELARRLQETMRLYYIEIWALREP
jgi:hypothetical protein